MLNLCRKPRLDRKDGLKMVMWIRCVALSALFLISWQVQAATLAARGEYIARIADCNSCHTAPGGKPFAGGDELKTPFGTAPT